MQRPKVTPELILSHGEQLRGIRLSWQRAAELAPEVEKLNAAAIDNTHLLDFNDEPTRFLSALAQLKGKAK